MDYLVDSGVLLRLVERTDALHPIIAQAVDILQSAGHRLITTPQNISEFWNVCTRPASARGGLGISPSETDRRLRFLEQTMLVVPEPADTYSFWRQLVVQHQVSGAKVHDARLAAMMLSLSQILTLNPTDFSRYTELTAITPQGVIDQNVPPARPGDAIADAPA